MVLDRWGFEDLETRHFGIQQMKGNRGTGPWIASASYAPLKKNLPGVTLKETASLEILLSSPEFSASKKSLFEALLNSAVARARKENLKAFVVELTPLQDSKLFQELGFERIPNTGFFKKLF